MDRDFDIVIFGASGFTGKLVLEHFLEHYNLKNSIKLAMAGRSKEKLEDTKKSLLEKFPNASKVPILLADSFDEPSLKNMAKKTKVVLTTVGPYLKYGESLVKACVEEKTHYCDLTGESPFIFEMIEKYHDLAKEKQVKIIHSCGFDSIPSDLGVLALQEWSLKNEHRPFTQIEFLLKKAKGGASGGTIASVMEILNQSKNKKVKKVLLNPYSLYPKNEKPGLDGRDPYKVRKHKHLNYWLAPFLMGPINTRIVRRSNALLNFKYGKNFRYSEEVITGKGLKGKLKGEISNLGIGTFILLALKPWSRSLFLSRFLPGPGDGPNRDERESGFFKISLYGRYSQEESPQAMMEVFGPKDPGYGSTSIMLAESALSLALNEVDKESQFGVVTPSSGIGLPLIDRLEKFGLKFEVKNLNS